jgi:hypothetical protein
MLNILQKLFLFFSFFIPLTLVAENDSQNKNANLDQSVSNVEYTLITTPPVIVINHVGLSTIDTLPDYIPPYSEVLVDVIINGGIEDGTIELGGVVLNWQVNSLSAGVYLRSMPLLFNLLYQNYHYIKRIDAYPNGTKIYWWVTALNVDGEMSATEIDSFMIGSLAIDDEPAPSTFKLDGNYPNPFNPTTNINFSVKYISEISLSIHALDGKLVRSFLLGNLEPGSHSIGWDGRDHSLSQVPSGIYIYRFQSEHHSDAGKMTLLK